MKRIPDPRIAVPAILALSLALAPLTYGKGSYPNTWNNRYPNSTTDDAAAASGSICYLCHTPSGTSTWNAYGNAIKRKIDGGMSLFSALPAVEAENSDGDPAIMPSLPEGWTNVMEITNNAQPGWTSGQNTYYDADGNALGTMAAPSGMTLLDPSGETPTETATWGRLKAAFTR